MLWVLLVFLAASGVSSCFQHVSASGSLQGVVLSFWVEWVEVDWWCLGILTFELCSGHPPFESATPMQIYSKAMRCQLYAMCMLCTPDFVLPTLRFNEASPKWSSRRSWKEISRHWSKVFVMQFRAPWPKNHPSLFDWILSFLCVYIVIYVNVEYEYVNIICNIIVIFI